MLEGVQIWEEAGGIFVHSWPPDWWPGSFLTLSNTLMSGMDLSKYFLAEWKWKDDPASSHNNPCCTDISDATEWYGYTAAGSWCFSGQPVCQYETINWHVSSSLWCSLILSSCLSVTAKLSTTTSTKQSASFWRIWSDSGAAVMEALERVLAMIRSLPGKWETVNLYLIIQRRNRWTWIGSYWRCFMLDTGTKGLWSVSLWNVIPIKWCPYLAHFWWVASFAGQFSLSWIGNFPHLEHTGLLTGCLWGVAVFTCWLWRVAWLHLRFVLWPGPRSVGWLRSGFPMHTSTPTVRAAAVWWLLIGAPALQLKCEVWIKLRFFQQCSMLTTIWSLIILSYKSPCSAST